MFPSHRSLASKCPFPEPRACSCPSSLVDGLEACLTFLSSFPWGLVLESVLASGIPAVHGQIFPKGDKSQLGSGERKKEFPVQANLPLRMRSKLAHPLGCFLGSLGSLKLPCSPADLEGTKTSVPHPAFSHFGPPAQAGMLGTHDALPSSLTHDNCAPLFFTGLVHFQL